jgi:hypothetical protein
MIDLIQPLLVFYFLIVPLMYNFMWQETLGDGKGKSFLKWFFTKSERVNWLGFCVFLILGLGCFVYYILMLIGELLFYTIALPICWLFEFLFLNKDCSNIVCDDLKEKKKK